jgi:Resolvase, N terminal domain
MVLTVLGMVAEMEVGFIRERQRAGIEAAKARGVYKGRPVTLDHAEIIDLHKKGNGPPLSPRPSAAPEGRSTRYWALVAEDECKPTHRPGEGLKTLMGPRMSITVLRVRH